MSAAAIQEGVRFTPTLRVWPAGPIVRPPHFRLDAQIPEKGLPQDVGGILAVTSDFVNEMAWAALARGWGGVYDRRAADGPIPDPVTWRAR